MTSFAVVLHSLPRATSAAAEDERDRFARALNALQPEVTTMIWRLLGWSANAAEVEDVLQEVLLRAWSSRRRLRDRGAFGAWVRTIAVRQARNHIRSRVRRARLLALVGFGPGAEPPAASRDDDAPADVRESLGRLRHADREMLVLRYLEGHSVHDICALLDLGRAAVDARLSRARRRLRIALGEEAEP